MPKLPAIAATDPTLDAAFAAMEAANRTDPPRPYLGMSAIGEECERRLWYSFRWCFPAGGGFDAKGLANVQDGHLSEDVMAARLRMVPGVELWTIDPSTGKQFGFSDVGGHFRGHCDGIMRGLLQAPKAIHVWEHKASEKGPAELARLKQADEKSALQKWNGTYYAQAVVYMHKAEVTRHYLTCGSPGGRLPITSVRTDANPAEAARLIEKAERIIFAPEPLPRLSEDPAHYKCKQCPASAVCHSARLPQPSCRTCLHATPERDGDGAWSCALAKDSGPIPVEFQRTGCERHLYIPALLSRWGEQFDASEEQGWVAYRAADGLEFRNGQDQRSAFTSAELAAATPEFIRAPEVQALREKGGTIVAMDEAA